MFDLWSKLIETRKFCETELNLTNFAECANEIDLNPVNIIEKFAFETLECGH